jgi:15-cis-phytoene synthase
MTPHQYCQEKAAQSGSSFYYSFLFLPKPRREAITAMYAFCREVDDVVDEVKDPDVARAKLGWWRAEVGNLFNGHPNHPVTLALQGSLADHGITRERMLLVIDGMEMDLVKHRYADFAELEKYCYLVAGVVGELSAGIFGYTRPATLEYARNLGMAFQLTNIIRDVGEDARRKKTS